MYRYNISVAEFIIHFKQNKQIKKQNKTNKFVK